MHTENERKFIAWAVVAHELCNSGMLATRPEGLKITKEQREFAYEVGKYVFGHYVNTNRMSSEEVAEAIKIVVLKFMLGDWEFSYHPALNQPSPLHAEGRPRDMVLE